MREPSCRIGALRGLLPTGWRAWGAGGTLLALYGIHLWRADWTGDFWEQSAAITAMRGDLIRPGHPSMAVDATHFFYSPYALVLALAARLTGVGAIGALAAAGGVNLLLIMSGAWRLIRRAGFSRPAAVYFYTLVCWLFVWGHDAWQYSGFLHFGVLFQVLPYPSSFAIGVMLWILSASRPDVPRWRLAGLGAVASVGLLSHPLTFLLLGAGLAGFYIGEFRVSRDPSAMLLIPGVAGGLALCWPYFPIWRLLPGMGGMAGVYAALNLVLYKDVLARTWPVWIVLPLLLTGDWSRGGRRAIGVAAILLLVTWGGGWLGRYAVFGRALAFSIMLIQVLFAERLAACESVALDTAHRPRIRGAAGAVVLLVLMTGLGASRGLVLHRLSMWRQAPEPLHQRLATALAEVPGDAIVLADRYTATLIPTFGVKTVCGRFPQVFVADYDDRARAVTALFSGESDVAQWEAVRARWDVTHILVNRERVEPPPEAVMQAGRHLFARDDLLLIEWTGGGL